MYFTAHGRALPCCIAPFSVRGYDSFTLGDATHADAAGNLERRALPRISRGAVERLPARRLRQLRSALEPVMPEPRPRRRFASSRPSTNRRHRRRCRGDPARCRRSSSSSSTAAAATAPSPAPAPPAPSHQRAAARLWARLPGRRRGGGRLRHHRVSRRRRQRLPGADPASCRAARRRSRGFRHRLAHSRDARERAA